MIGLDIFASRYLEENAVIKKILKTVFTELPNGMCYVDGYEIIVNHEAVKLEQLTSPDELAGILGDERTMMTCGRFFCYPENSLGKEIETFEEFYFGACQAVILVIDVGYVELYAKDEGYLSRCLKALQKVEGTVELECVEPDTLVRKSFRI